MKKLIKKIIRRLVIPSIQDHIECIRMTRNKVDELEADNASLMYLCSQTADYSLRMEYVYLAKDPLVSIIMPTHNRAFIIEKAIKSVLQQTYKNWQLLIMDDGSTDNTDDVVKPYLNDRRIQYYKLKKLGVCKTRNSGLAMAGGEYFAYLDTDDSYRPYFLSNMLRLFERYPTIKSAYCAYTTYLPENLNRIQFEEFNYEKLREGNYINLNTFVHKFELYEELGGFDTCLTRLVDWDLILKYTKDNPCLGIPMFGVDYYEGTWERITNSVERDSNFEKIKAKHA